MLDLQAGVSGSNALKAQLEKLKKKASNEQLTRALVAGGHVLKRAIEERMPVRSGDASGDAQAPGALRDDIHIKLAISEMAERRLQSRPPHR